MKTFEIANAKINLYLDVSRKREDGYHDVTTLMHQISLCDELWIEAHESVRTLIKLRVDGGGDDIPCDHRNLVYKAAELFLKRLGKSMNVEIHLLKNIPSIKYLLYIDEKGFEENLSSNPVGFVAWSDVEKLEVKPFFTAKFYGITLKSPEKYYKNDKNQVIMFTSQLFNDKADEVEQIIRYHIDKNKK